MCLSPSVSQGVYLKGKGVDDRGANTREEEGGNAERTGRDERQNGGAGGGGGGSEVRVTAAIKGSA